MKRPSELLPCHIEMTQWDSDLLFFYSPEQLNSAKKPRKKVVFYLTTGGLVVEPGDYAGVEDEIRWFIENSGSEKLREMGEKNRAYLVENLTEKVSVEKYKDAILTLGAIQITKRSKNKGATIT